jgi:hypothetical protein
LLRHLLLQVRLVQGREEPGQRLVVAALVLLLLLQGTAVPWLLHAAARALNSLLEQLTALQLSQQARLLFQLLLLPLEVANLAALHLARTVGVLPSLLLLLHHSHLPERLLPQQQQDSVNLQAVLLRQRPALQQAHCRLLRQRLLLLLGQSLLGC